MFIAHLPAAYLLSKVIISKRYSGYDKTEKRNLLALAMCASVLPDFDLFYFYLVDHGKYHHHYYWPHIPFYWLIIILFTVLLIFLFRRFRFLLPYFFLFFINIFWHLVLDSLVGGIAWLYPFSDELFYLVKVEAVNSWWVANFIWHWTFGLELLIIYWAVLVMVREKSRKSYSI